MTYDFIGIKTEFKTRLASISDWSQILYFGTIERIGDAVSFVVEKLVYVAEFYFRESNLITATLPATIIPRARVNSYTEHRKIGAQGWVEISADPTMTFYTITNYNTGQNAVWISGNHVATFAGVTKLSIDRSTNNDDIYTIVSATLDTGNTKLVLSGGTINSSVIDGIVFIYSYQGLNVSIPKWFKFQSTAGISNVYAITDDTYANGAIGNQRIQVKEGVPKSLTYRATGTTSEVATIYSSNVDNSEIDVYVVDEEDIVLYTVNVCGRGSNPPTLFFVNDLVNYWCEISNSTDFQKVEIKFGDDIYSRRLSSNLKLLFKYADTTGSSGNIVSTNIITTIPAMPTDVSGATATLYVTNKDEISNGSDHETMSSIKSNSSRLFFAGYRATGFEEWVSILDQHPYIYRSKIWVRIDEPANFNKIYATAISQDGSALTTTEQGEVTLYMKEKKSPTEVISWQPLNIVYLLSKIHATVQNKPASILDSAIKDVLTANYGIKNTDFKTNVFYLNYTDTIKNNVTYINYLKDETELFHMEKNNGFSFNYTVTDYPIIVSVPAVVEAVEENQVLLQPGTTELWLKRYINDAWGVPFRIAYDASGAGTLTGDNGFTLTSSDLDYVDNTISYFVDTLTNVGTYGLRDIDWVLYIAYKTQDGTGAQKKHIRITSEDTITDVDLDYTFTNYEYV